MAISIKNKEVERLVDDITRLTNESKTEAILKALAERRARLALGQTLQPRGVTLANFLSTRVWPNIPKRVSRCRQTSAEEDEVLGYAKKGF